LSLSAFIYTLLVVFSFSLLQIIFSSTILHPFIFNFILPRVDKNSLFY